MEYTEIPTIEELKRSPGFPNEEELEKGPREFFLLWAADNLNAYEKILQSLRADAEGKEIGDRFKPMV